jgi:MoxR-like ATPase
MATATAPKASKKAKTASSSGTTALASKFRDIMSELRIDLVEREVEVDLLARSIIGRTNGLMIGEPGTAKSFGINSFLKHIDGAQLFELLLAKDTPSEQVLGPVSLAALEKDEFKRITTGKAPESNLIFLDEVFKANSTVLNAMLKIINERKFDNNGHSIDVPLWCALGASNELPGTDRDDLRAFRDRFGWTKMVDHVRTSEGLKTVINGQLQRARGGSAAPSHTTLTVKEVEELQEASANVKVPDSVVKGLSELRSRAEQENLRISVRRMFEGVKLMQAGAVLTDRTEVSAEDMKVFEHVLWSDPEDHAAAYQLTLEYAGAIAKKASKLRGEFEEQQQALTDLQSEMPTNGEVPETELMGAVGKASNMLKKLNERVEAAVETAQEEGHDHSELDTLTGDIATSREHVKSMLGIGN